MYGTKVLGEENGGDVRCEAEAFESGESKQRRVGQPLLELPQPRLDIAAKVDEAKVGTEPAGAGAVWTPAIEAITAATTRTNSGSARFMGPPGRPSSRRSSGA